tara:strand:- start:543 stop:1214 length:672 start_codon:yes stop_codon:yes gene_type:complete
MVLHISLIISSLILLIGCSRPSNSNNNSSVNSPILPFIGQQDFEYDNKGDIIDTLYHTIPDFYFTAHDSTAVTNETVEGKVYVADFFFTNCPSICPIMTGNMKTFHENTKDIKELVILSHTIDPGRDTLAQLNHYIKIKEIDTRDDWFFLYGAQDYTYELGKYGYLINADIDPDAEGGFLHSEHFVLIDREGRIRGMYEGTDPMQVELLEKDIRKLIKVEYGK